MAEQEQQEAELPKPTPPKKRSLIKSTMKWFLYVVLFIVAALAVMFSTDKGSKFLLDSVLERQQMIKYQYEDGNLLTGIILKNVLITLESVDVKIDRADVSLGWRAIIHKEIHLRRGDVNNLQIILKSPPSDEPFKYDEIRLPFILRVDQADVDRLLIRTSSDVDVEFKDVHLEKALWEGTDLSFHNTRLDMGYLNVKNANGTMNFIGKYPINAKAVLDIPSLNESLNIRDIQVVARGTLDTIETGFATNTPDLLYGWGIVQPMHPNVPMRGEVKFRNYHLPFLTEQELFAKKGVATFNGNVDRLNINLNTSLSGKDIPEGQYTSFMHTDLVNQLDIEHFNGQLLDGAVNLAGVVSWKDHVTWDVNGRLDKIKPTDKIIPEVVREFLPPSLDAALASKGSLEKGLHLTADVNFDRFEKWHLALNQNEAKNNKSEPLDMNVSWSNMDRALPYIGWLKSDSGKVKLDLLDAQQNIQFNTFVKPHEKSALPSGLYDASLIVKDNNLNVPRFSFNAGNGGILGSAFVELPTEKRQLKWNALVDAKNFNPQTIVPAAPVNLVNGRVKANGYAKPNQQIIHLSPIQLTGRLADQSESVRLSGKSTIALLFNDEKHGGSFKSFAVVYDGALNASSIQGSAGYLKANIAGTTEYIKIHELRHKGVAGQISANGIVNLARGIGWNIDASLIRFKPQYFTSGVKGEISGVVKSEGLWADTYKRINVNSLNLAGRINNKTIRGTGNISLVLGAHDKGFLPQHFEANNLFLSYAQNQIQATGNAQNLNIKINAPALYEIYSGLRGKAYGYLNVQAQPRLKAVANLTVDGFNFDNLISMKQLRIQGELPTSDTAPTILKAKMTGLRSGDREIKEGEISIAGMRRAHMVKVKAENKLSKFYVQLAGGFTPNNDWLGQIQKGDFDSLRTRLVQKENASVIYRSQNSDLFIGAHCWMSQQSQLCFDQPVRVSKTNGNVSFITQNLDLADFAAFMPDGLAITGKLNGYAKASWAQGQKPKIDAKLLTRNGVIGIAGEDPQEIGSNLRYDQISLILKSVSQGLQLRLDAKTPDIGAAYANVVIDPYTENKAMKGEVALANVNLKVFKPFIADVRRLEGDLSFAGKINGSLSKPLITGDMRLKNGVISMISLPINLTNVQLYSAIRQDNASINGAFNSGRGVGKLTGDIDWRGEPRISLKLKGDNLLVRQAPLITAIANTDISLEVYPMLQRLALQGEVEIPRALISMPESSAPVVALSPDVRVVHEGQDQLALLKAAKPWSIRADLDVRLGNQVVFQGFDSRIPLTGRIYLTQRGSETAMRANGAIGVSQRVKIDAYGQSLDLNRAIARFNGALDNPSLDIDTNKNIQGSLVGVRISGTASSPSIQIYNDAGLSEQEALNALITGRINEGSSGLSQTEGFKSDVNNTIAAAGISMGLGGTRALTNQIGRTLGLSGLALDAQGTGDDTQVSVTGYITPDLFIRYGVGVFTPVNKLTLRYQMNQRLYMEASQSLERAIDFFYNWRF